METDWFEILPEYCPPSDVNECAGAFYRIAQGDPATSADFFSQRKLQPGKVFTGKGIDECIARSISLFSDINDAKKRLKLPKFRDANIALVTLEQKDGVMKKTFDASHYSWWRTSAFDVSQAKIIRL